MHTQEVDKVSLPDLSIINIEACKRYHEMPHGSRAERVTALRVLDAHRRRCLEYLFEKLPRQGRYLAYRLIGTNHIFIIARRRGRKDIRYSFLCTDETLDQHWMNWVHLGSMSGVGGLFLFGIANLYDIDLS